MKNEDVVLGEMRQIKGGAEFKVINVYRKDRDQYQPHLLFNGQLKLGNPHLLPVCELLLKGRSLRSIQMETGCDWKYARHVRDLISEFRGKPWVEREAA